MKQKKHSRLNITKCFSISFSDYEELPPYQPLIQEYQEPHAEVYYEPPEQTHEEYIADAHNAYQEYIHQEPVEGYEEVEDPSTKSNSDFLLKNAFQKVPSLFDNLFYRG